MLALMPHCSPTSAREEATPDADAQRGGLDGLEAALDLDPRDGHAHRVADLR